MPLQIVESDDSADSRNPQKVQQTEGGDTINFYIRYVGPLGGDGRNKKIKVDISKAEVLVFESIQAFPFLGYSDLSPHQLQCYSLEEILVEKLRSVMQRMQARDLYDIWYLLEVHNMNVNDLISEFRIKCESKGINPLNFHTKLEQRLPQYKGRWESSLSDQIHNLHDFDQVARETRRHLRRFMLE